MMTSRRCSVSAPRKPPRNSLAAALALAALAAAGAQPASSPAPAAAAGLLVAAARDSLAMGYADAADGFLAEALDLSPSDPDANYLSALMAARSGASPASVMPYLERALSGGAFRSWTRGDAALLYASLLVRTREPHAALRFLAGLPRDAELLRVESVAQRLAGNPEGARRAILESLARFPRDPRALLSWLLAADRPTVTPGDRQLIDAAFRGLDALKETDMRILFALAPYAPNPDASRLMIREYRAMDGGDARALALALRLGLVGEEAAAAEVFSGRYALDAGTLADLAGAMATPAGRAALALAFSTYSGSVGSDADRDGFPEAVSRYENGTLAAWAWDPDQDGVPSIEAGFRESAPVELLARSGGTTVMLRFGPWPRLSSATVSDASGSRAYAFAPGAVTLPVPALSRLSPLESGPWLASRGTRELPSETWLAARAIRAEKRSGGLAEAWELYDGEALRSWWRAADGSGGLAWYRAGVPSEDRADLDGDGRLETRRYWIRSADGMPVMERLESDLDGDGVFEYRKRLVVPLLETWDTDADGLPDLGFEPLDGDRKAWSFSARGDGRLDTRAVLAGGVVVSAERDGQPLALVPDSGGQVTWLGRKPFDFGRQRPEPGMGARNGVRYAVMELGGRLYAEALE